MGEKLNTTACGEGQKGYRGYVQKGLEEKNTHTLGFSYNSSHGCCGYKFHVEIHQASLRSRCRWKTQRGKFRTATERENTETIQRWINLVEYEEGDGEGKEEALPGLAWDVMTDGGWKEGR